MTQRQPDTPPIKVAVVGEESIHCLQLAALLRKLLGQEHVTRLLEPDRLLSFAEQHQKYPTIAFIDLFSYDLDLITDIIGTVRTATPHVVFVLYLDKATHAAQWETLPAHWRKRLKHYYHLYRDGDDVALEPIVRQAVRKASNQAYLTLSMFRTGAVTPPLAPPPAPPARVFISYSRTDWDGFVVGLVQYLEDNGRQVWVDQHLLVGGDDWMDSIGAALDECPVLLLVVSPEAVASKYVRMEYRYFFNHDKPIIPLLVHDVEKLPVEIDTLQYLDFRDGGSPSDFEQLLAVLAHHVG